MMNDYDMSGWGWLAMMLVTVIVIATLALVIWAVARRPGDGPQSAQSARETLDARLASGAIDVDEYGTRLEALKRS